MSQTILKFILGVWDLKKRPPHLSQVFLGLDSGWDDGKDFDISTELLGFVVSMFTGSGNAI
jgi:hypothetical protein